MVLSLDDIKEIIINNPNGKRISKAVEQHNLLNMHVNGVNVDAYIEEIKHYENSIQRDVRKRLSESNKGLFHGLLHPTQKVFSAKGGARRYHLSETLQKELKIKLSNTSHGLPLKKWLEKKIFNKYITDPNGVLFMEVSDNTVKPTFKSITSIFDYKSTGQKVEYIVFKPFKDKKDKNIYYFRVVDDEKDYLIKRIKKDGNDIFSIVRDETYENVFGYCPAFVVSDIFHPTEEMQTSFIDEVLEKANKFFFDNSIHTVHKLLHGFSKYWEYGRDCMNCNGTGIATVGGESTSCHICNGTGSRPNGDVSDKLIVPFPNGDEKVITKFSGFESPDISIWKQYKEDLKDHEKDLVRMLWNTNYTNDTKSSTATGRFLDIQPVNEKLNTISDNFERLEKFITDSIGLFYFDTSYNGASIINGRRYLVESTDVIWEKLTKAIKDNMPVVHIADISKEYIESRYSNNEYQMEIMLKLLEIEPFAYMTVQDVISLNVSENDVKKKIYFQEWYSDKSDAELILKDKSTLKKELEEYTKTKSLIIN